MNKKSETSISKHLSFKNDSSSSPKLHSKNIHIGRTCMLLYQTHN